LFGVIARSRFRNKKLLHDLGVMVWLGAGPDWIWPAGSGDHGELPGQLPESPRDHEICGHMSGFWWRDFVW
jgi:hypothetical protein